MADAILLAKAAIAGQCKSRLAVTIGEEAAARFAYLSMNSVRERLLAAGFDQAQYCVPRDHRPWFDAQNLAVWSEQCESSLGARMLTAILAYYDRHQAGEAVVLVGTDCPVAPFENLYKTIVTLSGDTGPRCVLGPTFDGGYWAIGLNYAASQRIKVDCLEQVEWSSGHELKQTIQRLEHNGCVIDLLEELAIDVDHFEDLRAIAPSLQGEDWHSYLDAVGL